MKIDQYCQRQHCKHIELEQFLACFRDHVTRVFHRQLGFPADSQHDGQTRDTGLVLLREKIRYLCCKTLYFSCIL